MSDLRQSEQWAEYMTKIGWEVVELDETKAYLKKLPILGYVIKIPRLFPIPYGSIDSLAKKRVAFSAKIEPNVTFDVNQDIEGALKENNYFQDNWSFAPTKTIRIDLSPSPEKILASFRKETRYAIRKAEWLNYELRIMNNAEGLDQFTSLYKQTAKRTGFWTGSIEELKLRWEIFNKAKKADIFLAFRDNELLAGAMVFYHAHVAYYYHAASTTEGQKMSAPSLIVWEIVKRAKERLCGTLDLEGVKDSRIPSTKKWDGFTKFKKGFNNNEVVFIGSYSKYYNPIIGFLFRLVQRLGV